MGYDNLWIRKGQTGTGGQGDRGTKPTSAKSPFYLLSPLFPGPSVRMSLADVVRCFLHGDMPTAVVAGRHMGVALGAIKRTTMEELFDPGPITGRDAFDVDRHQLRGPAAVAGTRVVLGDDRLVVVVKTPGDYP